MINIYRPLRRKSSSGENNCRIQLISTSGTPTRNRKHRCGRIAIAIQFESKCMVRAGKLYAERTDSRQSIHFLCQTKLAVRLGHHATYAQMLGGGIVYHTALIVLPGMAAKTFNLKILKRTAAKSRDLWLDSDTNLRILSNFFNAWRRNGL